MPFPSLKALALHALEAEINFDEVPQDLHTLIQDSLRVSYEEVIVNDLINKRKKKKVYVSNELTFIEFIVALIKINSEFALENCLSHWVPISNSNFALGNYLYSNPESTLENYSRRRILSGMGGVCFSN